MFASCIAFSKAELLVSFRDKTAIFWTFAFPSVLLILIDLAFGKSLMTFGQVTNSPMYLCSGVIAITIMSGGLFGIGVVLAQARQKGIIRRYYVTPMHSAVLIVGLVIRQMVLIILSTTLLLVIAVSLLGANFPSALLDGLVVCLLGTICLSDAGALIALSVNTTDAATAVANVAFMPLMFLSGTTIPRSLFPEWLQTLTAYLPTTQMTSALTDAFYQGKPLTQLGPDLLGITLWTLIFGLAAILLTNRSPQR